ncbi:MAG: four-carbon acid sugar kinase family protein [Chloroflexota bacterium]
MAIDDDPTGVQTVHDTPVLLTWAAADVRAQMRKDSEVFFILTNSRSLPEAEAVRISTEIGASLTESARAPFAVASRSDSTLRGHFPSEPLALADGLGQTVDGILLIPAFFEGGRYTIGDTHWVATPEAQSAHVISAAETSFARDPVFGYRSAHLPTWVEERSQGRWRAQDVRSLGLDTVRQGPQAVAQALDAVTGGVPMVVNAAGYGDLTQFTLGLLDAEKQGKRFLYRTAASFVRIRAGQAQRPLLTAEDILSTKSDGADARRGALVIVGSFQPSTTGQLTDLMAAADLHPHAVSIDVSDVLAGRWEAGRAVAEVDTVLARDGLAVVSTTRRLITGADNLAIGRSISDALVDVVRSLHVEPRFVVAKGGMTSHDIARRGLGAERAMVLGQLQAGVPVWWLESGAHGHNHHLPYVVFPGNVGGLTGLADAVRTLWSPREVR